MALGGSGSSGRVYKRSVIHREPEMVYDAIAYTPYVSYVNW